MLIECLLQYIISNKFIPFCDESMKDQASVNLSESLIETCFLWLLVYVLIVCNIT